MKTLSPQKRETPRGDAASESVKVAILDQMDLSLPQLDQPEPPKPSLLRPLKPLLGWLAFRSGLYRLFFRRKGAIVLFHRVDNRFKDNPISCSVDSFRSFCTFFARYFEVISLSELVRRLRDGKSVSGTLVINFDDGYKDNYTQAAPVLEEHGLPATYFVATDFIGSESMSEWDAKRNVCSEWMTWDHLRDLTARGFEIGAHTCSHPDLGLIGIEEAADEIKRSKETLESQLGAPVNLFSYPFGAVTQIREENRSTIKGVGFICCASAYGGVVRPQDDPFMLRRQPVSQDLESPWALGFELLRTRR